MTRRPLPDSTPASKCIHGLPTFSDVMNSSPSRLIESLSCNLSCQLLPASISRKEMNGSTPGTTSAKNCLSKSPAALLLGPDQARKIGTVFIYRVSRSLQSIGHYVSERRI